MASLEQNSSITILPSVYFELQNGAYQAIVMTALQVIYLAVFVLVLWAFLKNGVRTVAKKAMLFMLMTMAASTTAAYALFVSSLRSSFIMRDSLSSGKQHNASAFLLMLDERTVWVLLTLNIIISDIIVSWRAVVVWRNNKVVLAISIVTTLVSFCGWVVEATLPLQLPPFLIAALGTLAVNIWATGAIGARFWKHRKARKDLPAVAFRCRASTENTLAILIESGLLYVAHWIVFIALSAFGVNVWATVIMVELVPLYPTATIFLVALHKMPLTDILAANDSERGNGAITFARPNDDSWTNPGVVREVVIVGHHSIDSTAEVQMRCECECSRCSREKPESQYVPETA